MKNKKNKEKQKKVGIAVISIIFLVSSIAGVVLYRPNNSNKDYVDIDGWKFRISETDRAYYLSTGGREIKFYNLPNQLQHIDYDDTVGLALKNSQNILFTFNPEDLDLAYIEKVRFDLQEEFSLQGKQTAAGITRNSTLYNLPIVTCSDATPFVPVVKFSTANETYIKNDNNCIQIVSTKLGYLQLRDRIIYELLGVL